MRWAPREGEEGTFWTRSGVSSPASVVRSMKPTRLRTLSFSKSSQGLRQREAKGRKDREFAYVQGKLGSILLGLLNGLDKSGLVLG